MHNYLLWCSLNTQVLHHCSTRICGNIYTNLNQSGHSLASLPLHNGKVNWCRHPQKWAIKTTISQPKFNLPHLLATHHISTFNIGLVDSWPHKFPLCNVHWQVANWWQTIVSPSGNSADRTLPFRQCRQTNYPLHLSISVILLRFNYFFSNPSSLQSLFYVSGISIEVNQASHLFYSGLLNCDLQWASQGHWCRV